MVLRVDMKIGNDSHARAEWRKSSYSNAQSNCVEVATNLHGKVAVRDSKQPDGPQLVVSAADWRCFLAAVREG